jgi:hypothetical protein
VRSIEREMFRLPSSVATPTRTGTRLPSFRRYSFSQGPATPTVRSSSVAATLCETQSGGVMLAHLAGVLPDLLKKVLPIGVELVSVAIEESLREPVHAPKRRSEVVRNRVAERLELTVCRLDFVFGRPSREPCLRPKRQT